MSVDKRIAAFLLSISLRVEFLDCKIENPFLMTKTPVSYDSNYAFNIPLLRNIQ